ncbi:b-1,4-glucosyltransferase [candidate division LCP-89 bacterium B3_LCP]|uniref:B-1,4-glucosyltransferase n=1 Tax=candidate division LCP-89 bacterium B3_LCP TaxID=2012998 RepID=A0A532V3F3_UNCL8|nr:MAG: b-1,4-glucosyltransferase [candidate division LCP-89 bacterium B3_LCP]
MNTTERKTLAVCMIAHNEADKIKTALDSVQFADQLVVVDCQSDDNTADVASQSGAQVFKRPNLRDLNVNKNFSFDQAQTDFILCLDADEVIPQETREEIISILSAKRSEVAYFIPRCNHWKGQWLKHGGNYPDRQLRLFKHGSARFPEKHLHERLQVQGKIGYLRHPMHHFPYQNSAECQRKLDFYTSFEADHLHKQGVSPSWWVYLRLMIWMPLQRLLRRYIFKMGFLDGKAGWEAVLMDMQNFRLRYQKLSNLSSGRTE